MTAVEGFRQARADIQQEKQFALTSQAQELAINQSKATMMAQQKFIEMSKGIGSGLGPGGKPGQPPDPYALATTTEQLAKAAFDSGQPEKGTELMSTASTMRNNASLMAQRDLEGKTKKAELGLKLIQGVTDQPSWDRSVATFQMLTGESSPYAGMEYSPELVEQLKGSLVSALDQAKIGTEQERAKAAAATARHREQQGPLIRSQIDLNAAYAERARKEGGLKPDTVEQFRTSAVQLIKTKYDMEDEMVKLKALDIAERAQELQAATPTLKRAEAMNKAMQEFEREGVFVGYDMMESDAVGTREAPLELPRPKSESPKDREKWAAGLEENKFYSQGGQLWLWDAEKKVFNAVK